MTAADTPELIRMAQAHREVVNRHSVTYAHPRGNGYAVFEMVGAVWPEPFHGTREKCQAWIDQQAMRAALDTLLPVTDAVVKSMLDIGEVQFDDAEEPLKSSLRKIFAAAIKYFRGE